MRVILMSGATQYSGLIADWQQWQDFHRIKPDIVMVEHTFAAEELMNTVDSRRIEIREDKSGPQLYFMNVPVHCFCSLKFVDPAAFDCPPPVDETGAFILEPIAHKDVEAIEAAEPDVKPKPVKIAKSAKGKTKKR